MKKFSYIFCIVGIFCLVNTSLKSISKEEFDIHPTIKEVELVSNRIFSLKEEDRIFSSGLAPIYNVKSQKYSFIDKIGKEIFKEKYYYARNFSEGLAPVSLKKLKIQKENKISSKEFIDYSGNYGFINTKGEMIIKPQFQDAYSFSDELALIRNGNKYGYINKKGKVVIPVKYDYANKFSEGFACVKLGEKYQVIDKKGDIVFKTNYNIYLDRFSDELASFISIDEKKTGMHIGYIDKAGKEIIVGNFEDAKAFSQGLAPVKIKGKYGFINKEGNIKIKPIYDYAESFSEEIAKIMLNNKIGFINKEGKIIIEPIYNYGSYFSEGIIYLVKNGKSSYKNSQNKYIWQEK